MTRIRTIAVAIGLSIVAGSVPALAGQQVYTYSIIHPFYGDIGTFTDTIERSREAMRIDSRLRVAVTLLGIVIYRQESDITEIMQGSRLISLQSVTEKDGLHVEVNGKAQGDKFLVNATAGAFAGPASVAPSDPWVLKGIGKGTVVFTDTGRIIAVDISGGDYEMVSVNGVSVSARHFVVMGDKRQDVWVDGQEMPIMFRVTEKGSPIDFVLQNATTEADAGDTMEVLPAWPPVIRLGNDGK
jgi:hypothetical protein